MKRIFIFPTIEEAKAFILTEPRDPVFVGGVGMAEIAAATLRAVKAKKPQLVVLAGIKRLRRWLTVLDIQNCNFWGHCLQQCPLSLFRQETM